MPFAPYDDDDDDSPLNQASVEARHVQQLGDAMGRLHSFAVLHGPGEVIDQTSGLTTEDVNMLLDVLEKIHAIAKAAPKL